MEWEIKKAEIAKLVNKFEGYKNNDIDDKAILEFIEQVGEFCCKENKKNSVQCGIYMLLKNMRYWGENEIASELKELLRKIYIDDESVIIKYGNVDDSSYRLLNYLEKGYLIQDINTALYENKELIFIDDGVNSGHQIISIFQEFMGVELNKRATKEHHVKELSDFEKKRLKETNIVIGFIIFNEQVEKYIYKEFQKMGLVKIMIIYNNKFQPKLKNNITLFNDERQANQIIEFFEEIGLKLLQSNKALDIGHYKERWNPKRIRRSALGYNNSQQIVVFEYNIPTYTITAFWQSGDVRGKKWKALFNRED